MCRLCGRKNAQQNDVAALVFVDSFYEMYNGDTVVSKCFQIGSVRRIAPYLGADEKEAGRLIDHPREFYTL